MPPAGLEDRRARSRLLAVLCLISVIGPAATFLYLPALPEVARAFGTTEVGAQITLTAFLAGNCIGFALLGPAHDRFGHRRVFATAMTVFVIASLMAAAAPTLATLTVARLVQGIGGSAGVIAARSTIRLHFPDGGARELATLSAIVGMAPAASPLIGAAVLLIAAWRMTFVVAAAIGLVSLLLAIRYLPALPAATRRAAPIREDLANIFSHREIRAGLLMGSLNNSLFMLMMAGSPFVFVEAFGWSPLTYSLVFGVILASFAVVSMATGRAFSQHGLRRVMGWGLPGMAAGALVLLGGTVFASPWAVAGGLFLLIGSMGPVVPGNHMRMLTPYADLAGTVVGVSMLIGTAASIAAITAYGLVSEGSVPGFGVWLALLTFLSIAVWLREPPGEG